jgi:hypothetical protein
LKSIFYNNLFINTKSELDYFNLVQKITGIDNNPGLKKSACKRINCSKVNIDYCVVDRKNINRESASAEEIEVIIVKQFDSIEVKKLTHLTYLTYPKSLVICIEVLPLNKRLKLIINIFGFYEKQE